jgi:hypothetical protein
MAMKPQDLEDLKMAKAFLDNPSFAGRLMSVFGVVIEKGFERLPGGWTPVVQKACTTALEAALDVTLTTFDNKAARIPASNLLHKLSAVATGAAGGTFGLAALPVELPITTAIMLRSIADIARSEGENLASAETKMACLEVFALGGRSKSDNATETGYFVLRGALAKAVSDATSYIVERGAAEGSAPVLVRLIAQIASRFGAVVSEKAAASAIPVIGAVGGAILNAIFMDHFQDVARGHFTVLRLERVYGPVFVGAEYEKM